MWLRTCGYTYTAAIADRTWLQWGRNVQRHVCGVWTLLLLLLSTITAEYDLPESVYHRHTPASDFLPSSSNVTFHTGELAVLRCSVINLGTKTVVWRRLESSFPLTSGVMTFIADDRIQISHVDYKNQWDLVIKNVQPEDEGVYECQASSPDKNFRKLVSLTVLDTEVDTPEIQITGQQYIERGETIDLQCNATGEYYPPDEMDWFRNGHRMSSNEMDGIKISKQFSIARRTVTSNLKIDRASMEDSGTYVCRSSNMQIASTKVHVLNAEMFNIKRESVYHRHTPAPDFLPSSSNVTFHTGELAVLRCSVINLGTKTVVWRRLESSFPLTSGVMTFIADDRIQISHVDYKNQWDLVIKNVQPEDEGVYECQASSPDKNFRKLVSLTVLDTEVDTPEIQITGQQYIERGETIDLQCNATGEYYPPDEMDWFRNGHRMSSNEMDGIKISKQFSIARRTVTSNLKIDRASMEDSGTYVCRSSNMQIASTKVHVLNAEMFNIKRESVYHRHTPAPDFLPSSSNVTFHTGELAVLRCSVINLGTKTVVWRRLESSFPLTSGVMTFIADDRIQISHVDYKNQWDLVIKNVQPEDEGVYECQASSPDKNFRKLVSLTVLDTEVDTPEIQITGQQYIERGETIDLQCNATGEYYPPDEMDWFRNGHRMSSNEMDGIKISKQFSIARRTVTSNLKIDRASMEDSGTYVCRSSNMQIASTKVHVLNAEMFNIKRESVYHRHTPAPDFLPSSSNVTFHTGELAVLRCSVINLGTKTVVWRRLESSFPLTSGVMTFIADDRIQISHVDYKNQWDLMIKNVQPEDEGVYECQASSPDKNFRKLVSLTVLDTEVDTPEIQITGQQYIERGETIDLQCNATWEYYPPDKMDWFRNGHRMSSNEMDGIKISKQFSIARRTVTSNLKIDRASMEDSGTYVCRSSNMQIASTKVHVQNAEMFNIKRAGTHRDTEDDIENGDYASATGLQAASTILNGNKVLVMSQVLLSVFYLYKNNNL